MTITNRIREVSPSSSPHDLEMTRMAQRCIMETIDHSRTAAITVTTDAGEHFYIDILPAAFKLIGQLLGVMSEGHGISIVPSEKEFSTVEMAHFLNASRPLVIKKSKQNGLRIV